MNTPNDSVPSGTGVAPVTSSSATFLDLVNRELHAARLTWDDMADGLEAIGVIREEFDEFWDEVKKKQRDPEVELRELVQIAAMCQRAIEDLTPRFIHWQGRGPLHAAAALRVKQMRAAFETPLRAAHAAATWLRVTIGKLDDLFGLGCFAQFDRDSNKVVLLYELLIDLYSQCAIIVADLHLLDRVQQSRSKVSSGAGESQAQAGVQSFIVDSVMVFGPYGKITVIPAHVQGTMLHDTRSGSVTITVPNVVPTMAVPAEALTDDPVRGLTFADVVRISRHARPAPDVVTGFAIAVKGCANNGEPIPDSDSVPAEALIDDLAPEGQVTP